MLLVRAVETEDSDGLVLTPDDRQYATAAALASAPLGSAAGARAKAAFLAHRAQHAIERLVPRYPGLELTRKLSRWPAWLGWALPLAALLIGLATNIVEGSRLNILAFPLLGMLAWNLLIYAWLTIGVLRRAFGGAKRAGRHPVLAVVEWAARPAASRLASHPTLERAVSRFAGEWAGIAGRLTRHRTKSILHFSAAMFAFGIIAGMLARARYTTEYSAGWAGTWAGAENEIAALLGVILAPASAVTGIALPDIERLQALRGSTENAGDWLILWVVTACLLVIAPRLLMALVNGLFAALSRRRLQVDEDFYFRSVVRNAVGGVRSVRLIPYGFELSEEARQRVSRLLLLSLGDRIDLQADPAIPYGQEDDWLAEQGGSLTNDDQLILLFNLASTPEKENHGALAAGIRQRIGNRGELHVLVDDSAFRHKLRGQASAGKRLEDRLQAWRAVLAGGGLEPIPVTLDDLDEEGAALGLEQALLRGARRK